jgi:hypothetical protein
VNAADALLTLGGVATRAALIGATTRSDVDGALAAGEIVSLARGRYALPGVESAVARAHALSGVLSLTSSALHHGWAVKTVPDEPHIIVPRSRKVPAERRAGVQLHYQDLMPEDVVDDIATSKAVTLLQCLRRLPFDEALAVADSALRSGEQSALREAVACARGPGSPQVRRVAAAARAEAESCSGSRGRT